MNAELAQLLEYVVHERDITIDDLKESIDEEEILDRMKVYPTLSDLVHAETIDIEAVNKISNNLLVFATQDKIKFKTFLGDSQFAQNAIESLIKDFPQDDVLAAKRIDEFIEKLMNSHLSEGKNALKESHAALFGSLFLTVAFPERFVDFRKNRWTTLAKMLGYSLPNPGSSYGQMIVWAGKFSQDIAKTPVFQKYWQSEHPLWSVAGLSWNLKDEDYEKFIPGKIRLTKTEHDPRILNLLKRKGQIILYGPPGTGKTYQARQIILQQKEQNYQLSETSHLDQRVFSITIWPPRDGEIFELNPNDEFVYQWNEKRNWQKPYEELQEGDMLLAYQPSPFQQYRAILRCLEKGKDSIRLEYVNSWEGPTFKEMKEDPTLKETLMMRVSMTFSLKKLDEIELERIQALSPKLTNEVLGLSETKILETVSMSEFITFHPSFGYEEFIEGLRPETDEEGNLRFSVQDGIFKRFARQACNILLQKAKVDKRWIPGGSIPQLLDEEKERIRENIANVPFYLVIDEINRGDISRIFGELITLLEADKRYCEENELITTLPYSKQKFSIPPNLFILGTMNTADRSISLVDIALRRRFGFIELMPDIDVIRKVTSKPEIQDILDVAVDLLETINTKIVANYDRDHQIGHSYFSRIKDASSQEEAIEMLHFAWYHEIIPLLQEYFYDAPQKLEQIIGPDFVKTFHEDRSFEFQELLYGEDFLNAVQNISRGVTRQDIPMTEE